MKAGFDRRLNHANNGWRDWTPAPVLGEPIAYEAYVYPNKRIGARFKRCASQAEAERHARQFANQFNVVAVVYAIVDGQRVHAGNVQPPGRR